MGSTSSCAGWSHKSVRFGRHWVGLYWHATADCWLASEMCAYSYHVSAAKAVHTPVYTIRVSYLTILGSSIAPGIVMMKKKSTSHDVSFLLNWPVTKGLRDREAFTCPTLTHHCSASIGIWKVYSACAFLEHLSVAHQRDDFNFFNTEESLIMHPMPFLTENCLQCKKLNF